MSRYIPRASGWSRDLPDFRDYTVKHPAIREMLLKLPERRANAGRRRTSSPPTSVDLRDYFPDVYDQQNVNCSTAYACTSLIEYFEVRSHGRIAQPSALYLYKGARKLLRLEGNAGVDLRTGLKAMVRFGIAPDYLWPFDPSTFDSDPDPFLHSFSADYRSIIYLRLDSRNSGGAVTLKKVKAFLAAGLPVAFGFSLPSALSTNADIPYRPMHDSVRGGQTVVAVGYDDERLRTSPGALLIRNSWGTGWGEKGYGWLPYGFVERQMAADFWTILRSDWLESGEFEQPDLPRMRPRTP